MPVDGYDKAKGEENAMLSEMEVWLDNYNNSKEDTGSIETKAYRFGEQISILTPQNEMSLFEDADAIAPLFTAKLTEDVSDYEITFVGFSSEEENKMVCLTGEDFELGAIIGFIGNDRNIAYIGMIPEDSNKVTISKEQSLNYDENLLVEYSIDTNNYLYAYKFAEGYTLGNTVYEAHWEIIKFDFSNKDSRTFILDPDNESVLQNLPLPYTVKRDGNTESDIHIKVDGVDHVIRKGAERIEVVYEDIKVYTYVQDQKLYPIGVEEGAEIESDNIVNVTSFINLKLLPN